MESIVGGNIVCAPPSTERLVYILYAYSLFIIIRNLFKALCQYAIRLTLSNWVGASRAPRTRYMTSVYFRAQITGRNERSPLVLRNSIY